MQVSYLQNLNEKQMLAVTTDSQYCRVIAGAGSGKTRVLTNRMIYLIKEKNISPYQILAITFTNKACNEIKTRVIDKLQISPKILSIYTFHSLCLRFLRREGYLDATNKLISEFNVIDEEDQRNILKRILKAEGYNSKSLMYKELPGYISYQKNQGLYPEDIVIKSFNQKEKEKLSFYKLYQEELERCHLLDFDDLLLKTIIMLKNNNSIKLKWQRYFSHILIDEFQDTNDLQFEIISMLMNDDSSLYVVGDPDQTIYTWRGANQNILLNLSKKFYGVETIILEENYRSTGQILKVANNLISHNTNRIEKNLFTSSADGWPVTYHEFFDGYSEARNVIDTIQELVSSGEYDYKDIVIMYRAQYLTLPFDKLLTQRQIPYVIYGGQKFYQRMEIKDIIAYLRLLMFHSDNASFERVINIPRRGIGDLSLDKLREEARYYNLSMYDYLTSEYIENSEITSKALTSMKQFVDLLKDLEEKLNSLLINDFFIEFEKSIQYKDYLMKTQEDALDRYQNVETFISDIVNLYRTEENFSLKEYLENIALMSSQDYVKDQNNLTLMTVHTAKGLEFPVVFLVGLNEGVFPSARAIEEEQEKGLEEERRVCYVAFTRAMQRLYVSCFHTGFNGAIYNPSCFVQEAKLKDYARQAKEKVFYKSAIYTPPQPVKSSNVIGIRKSLNNEEIVWKIGDQLRHITFGFGIVIGVEEKNISVKFADGSIRKLLGNHSSITKIKGDGNNVV